MHYIQTFFKALQMTLRGETIDTPIRYPNLQAWLEISTEHLNKVFAIAEENNINKTQRQQIILQLDGRNWSMDLILSSVKFHLETEFPSLMLTNVEHNLTTLYALHFDDKYRISQLLYSDVLPAVLRPQLQTFAEHFNNIPPSTDP